MLCLWFRDMDDSDIMQTYAYNFNAVVVVDMMLLLEVVSKSFAFLLHSADDL